MKNINRKNQLYFDFGRDYEADLENFFFSSKNSILKVELNEIIEGSTNQKLFITAYEADGKTFLLNSLLNNNRIKDLQSIYIDVSSLKNDENYLEGLSSFDLVCLDNVHKIADNLEIQIFNLINECKATKTNLILASNENPNELNYLPDLISRFNEFKRCRINPIDDDNVIECMEFVALKLNLEFSKELIEFISLRIRRDFFSIKKTLQDFDKFLYSEKKQPTKISAASFLKSYFN
jgi:chromosomal replication initiation ATPase DnaA